MFLLQHSHPSQLNRRSLSALASSLARYSCFADDIFEPHLSKIALATYSAVLAYSSYIIALLISALDESREYHNADALGVQLRRILVMIVVHASLIEYGFLFGI